MSNGQSLESLVQTLEAHKVAKADYVASPKSIRMFNGLIQCEQTSGGIYLPNEVFHQQICEKLQIPTAYYGRMRFAAQDLMDTSVNKWLDLLDDKKGLLMRTFEMPNGDNIGRALLSDRYSLIDNYDVLFAALEVIAKSKIKVEVKECTVTDKRMYLHIIAPEVEINAQKMLKNYLREKGNMVGYGIVAGLVISNSEVGHGSYEINPRAYIGRCNNGLIEKDDSFRKVHLGGKMREGAVKWSQSTIDKNMDLILSQTRDAIKHFLSEGYLSGMVQKIESASKQELEHPQDTVLNVVREIAKTVTIDDRKKQNILNFFIKDGDHSAAGVFHAITREAQNMDADNRWEAEAAAFDILPKIKGMDKVFKAGKN